MKRKIVSLSLALSLIFTFIPKITFANDNLLYMEKQQQTITSGVTYEKSKRLYKSGWKDVYVLTVDIKNPNVSLEVLTSKTEHGLKKTTENLVKENGAIAGINGDFFGNGNPKSAMGQIIENGKEIEAQNYYNTSENKYAGIFLDNFGNIFTDYIKSNIRLYNSNVNLDLGAKNKITDFKKPVIFDATFMKTTADLDKRNKNLFKIVVENGIIKEKLGAGQVANIAENGYVVVMDKETATPNLIKFNIGEPITFTEKYDFVFRPNKAISEIKTGMSAGGEILRNGKIINQGLAISPKTNQPRTAVGVSQDKSKLIMVVVDGRGESVGATHNEMGQILLEYGAYDAINFDGGGSSTMVLRQEGDTEVSLVNKVSDKTQRLVPNGLGIKTTNQIGDLASIKIALQNPDTPILANQSYPLKITGYDSNFNPVNIDLSQVSISFSNVEDGIATNSSFTPNKSGELNLNATYQNLTSQLKINVKEPINSIKIKADETSLNIGEKTNISIKASNKDGYESYVDNNQVEFTVDNPEVATLEGNTIIGKSNGICNVTASYNGFSATISIAVGQMPILIEAFENPKQTFMTYFPEKSGVSGGSAIANVGFEDGGNSLLLSYDFKENIKSSQASYVCFEKSPIIFYDNPSYIQMNVKGDGSGNMLKAILKDSDNKQFIIPIIENLSSNDWTIARFPVPKEVKYPIRLDKIYVGTYQTNQREQGTIYIDNIQSIIKRTDGGEIIGGYQDPLNSDLQNTNILPNEEEINVFGQTANKPFSNSKQVLIDTINKMQNNATSLIFAGSSNLEDIKTNVPTIQWQNKYSTSETKNVSIINLATKSGNMLKESPNQWRWLQSYLNSFSKNNIIINMDKNIWDTKNNLKGTRENYLFHKILKEFVEKTGKNIIVVSAISDKTEVFVKDGIRYITLNGLTNNISSNLKNYKYLKIRATETDLKYQILNVYN